MFAIDRRATVVALRSRCARRVDAGESKMIWISCNWDRKYVWVGTGQLKDAVELAKT